MPQPPRSLGVVACNGRDAACFSAEPRPQIPSSLRIANAIHGRSERTPTTTPPFQLRQRNILWQSNTALQY
eukprot:4310013-Lingulodinium_polyedra.AAC.1